MPDYICLSCGEAKSPGQMVKDAQKKRGFRLCCRACKAAKSRVEYKAAAERLRPVRAAYYVRMGGAHQRDWARRNANALRESKRRWAAANRPLMRATTREWAKQNPDKRAQSSQRRRAMKAGSTVGPVDFESILLRSGGNCGICGDQVVFGEVSFDHIVPLARGGPHVDGNLQLAHLRCNSRKGTRIA